MHLKHFIFLSVCFYNWLFLLPLQPPTTFIRLAKSLPSVLLCYLQVWAVERIK